MKVVSNGKNANSSIVKKLMIIVVYVQIPVTCVFQTPIVLHILHSRFHCGNLGLFLIKFRGQFSFIL